GAATMIRTSRDEAILSRRVTGRQNLSVEGVCAARSAHLPNGIFGVLLRRMTALRYAFGTSGAELWRTNRARPKIERQTPAGSSAMPPWRHPRCRPGAGARR